ncbi:hypothetical protein [Bacillus amyloliquefaciens]|uniref:hypothetical protein n=1 Tax=Bacillus amyloliquefaciens TaxID=1390 RepID=UPI0006A93849|nr:hypothetical protein [Bacillus amyloliquefaciens]CUB31457.1 hypothetical protein BN2127_JRS5_02590 [Bacillus amyloliquefaciens]
MKKRSRGFPRFNLENTLKFAKLIRSYSGDSDIEKDLITKALGYKKYSGAVGNKIASLKHFGLLERSSGNYKLTQLSKRIIDSMSEKDFQSALRTAFLQPELFAELFNKYSSEGAIPDNLPEILNAYHEISDNSSEYASRIFIESALFANIIHKNKRIIKSNREETFMDKKNSTPSEALEQGTIEMQRFDFSLTNGKSAKIIVPGTLIKRDIQIIRKQIETLELQVEE